MASSLPEGFGALEPFVARFAVSGTAERAARRGDSSADERAAFFAAAQDLIGPALDQLDGKPLAALDGRERRLLDMALTFAHIALSIDIQGSGENAHARMREYMRILRSPADEAA